MTISVLRLAKQWARAALYLPLRVLLLFQPRRDAGALRPKRILLLNGAHIGTNSIVAAGTLITEGTKVPPRSLMMGSPGKVKRALSDDEVASIQAYADRYVGYRLEYMGG